MPSCRFQDALALRRQKIAPLWLMRQAGRYQSSYRQLRRRYSFSTLCKEPELAARVALAPIEQFDFDVAILFSDILFALEALDLPLEFRAEGPRLGRSLASLEDIEALPPVPEAVGRLAFQKEALQATLRQLPKDRSLIGFVGGPATLFSYAVFGSWISISNHPLQSRLQRDAGRLELMLDAFLQKIIPFLIANIELQLEGGAEMVMIFDTSAASFSDQQFQRMLLPRLKELASAFPRRSAYFARSLRAQQLASLFQIEDFAGLAIDHSHRLAPLLQRQQRGFIQGNLDPSLLLLDRRELEQAIAQFLRPIQALSLEERRGWICSLGHGLPPASREENVHLLVRMVREMT